MVLRCLGKTPTSGLVSCALSLLSEGEVRHAIQMWDIILDGYCICHVEESGWAHGRRVLWVRVTQDPIPLGRNLHFPSLSPPLS